MYTFLAFSAQPKGTPSYYRELNQLAAQVTDWVNIPMEAETHGLGPLLYAHLQAAEVSLPPGVKRQLQGLYLRHRHANEVRAQVLGEILAAYESAGIRVLVLKGAALAHLSYPQPGLRPMRDIDLLVEKPAAREAQCILADLGFTAPMAEGEASLPSKHLTAATRQTGGLLVSVEVHHDLFHDDYPISMGLENISSPPLAFTLSQGVVAYTLGYEDMLWHLCHHIVNIAHPFRLIWLADIAGLAELFAAELDWARIERNYPRILNILSLCHTMTPLSESLRQQASLRTGVVPRGIGQEFQGWPRFALNELNRQPFNGYRQIFWDTFCPSDWWLRLYYGVGVDRSLFWHRWLRHPLHILGFAASHFVKRAVFAHDRG